LKLWHPSCADDAAQKEKAHKPGESGNIESPLMLLQLCLLCLVIVHQHPMSLYVQIVILTAVDRPKKKYRDHNRYKHRER